MHSLYTNVLPSKGFCSRYKPDICFAVQFLWSALITKKKEFLWSAISQQLKFMCQTHGELKVLRCFLYHDTLLLGKKFPRNGLRFGWTYLGWARVWTLHDLGHISPISHTTTCPIQVVCPWKEGNFVFFQCPLFLIFCRIKDSILICCTELYLSLTFLFQINFGIYILKL